MMTYEAYVAYYEKNGRLPNDITIRKNKLNNKQLKSRYEAYLKSLERTELRKEKAIEDDEEWLRIKTLVHERDQFMCRLWDVLAEIEKEVLIGIDPFVIDAAHIFPRSTHPSLKYDPDNIVSLNRLFHARLDSYQNPVTGQPIDNQGRYDWFLRIIGPKKFFELESRAQSE